MEVRLYQGVQPWGFLAYCPQNIKPSVVPNPTLLDHAHMRREGEGRVTIDLVVEA